MTRLERWERAHALGLEPPKEVCTVFLLHSLPFSACLCRVVLYFHSLPGTSNSNMMLQNQKRFRRYIGFTEYMRALITLLILCLPSFCPSMLFTFADALSVSFLQVKEILITKEGSEQDEFAQCVFHGEV